MAKLETSGYFTESDMLGIGGIGSIKLSDLKLNPDNYDDVDDILASLGEQADYTMLPLAVKFMRDLTPFALFTFFDSFGEIEEAIFKAREIDYNPIKKSYQKYRNLLSKEYVKFIINYYSDSNTEVSKYFSELDKETRDFLLIRFSMVKFMLVEIGKRLSSEYYDNIIVVRNSNSN